MHSGESMIDSWSDNNNRGSKLNWYIAVLKKYVVFSGRAGRPEFWWFFLFNLIVSIVLVTIDVQLGLLVAGGAGGILSTVYSLATLLPSLGVSVRRLHDTNRSGWWMLILLVPLVGLIVLLVFFIMAGTPDENRHGLHADPSPS